MHPFNKTIIKYNIGKGSSLKFKNDPKVYYFEKFNPNGKGMFCKTTAESTIYNKHTKNLERVNGKLIPKEDVDNLLKMHDKIVEVLLLEGRYDSLTRKVVKDILNNWKEQYEDKISNTLEFEEIYEFTDSKQKTYEFELSAILKLKETTNKIYKVDGGADPQGTPAYLEVRFQVDPRDLPKKWEVIYNDLTDVIRHEVEHLTQEGSNVIPSKKMEDDTLLRNLIKAKLLPKSEYFKLSQEVDAMLQGMYLKAKKSKVPFTQVINDYFDKVKLKPEDRKSILDIWKKRAKELSLPQI